MIRHDPPFNPPSLPPQKNLIFTNPDFFLFFFKTTQKYIIKSKVEEENNSPFVVVDSFFFFFFFLSDLSQYTHTHTVTYSNDTVVVCFALWEHVQQREMWGVGGGGWEDVLTCATETNPRIDFFKERQHQVQSTTPSVGPSVRRSVPPLCLPSFPVHNSFF